MDRDNEGSSSSHQNIPEPEDKGKSRAIMDEEPDAKPSVMARLQDSARMAGGALMNNRVGLQSIPTTSEGKRLQSASSASSARPDQYQNAQSDTARHVPATAPSETFRQSQREAPTSSVAFNAFVDTTQPLPNVEGTQLSSQPRASDWIGWSTSGAHVAQARAADGSAVADLLSQPDDPMMMPTMEEQMGNISAEDAAKLRAALFDVPASGGLPWDHLLNFTPNFASSHNPPSEGQSKRQELLGIEDQDLAADNWLRQWHGVLVGYTDEVWGDLDTLVEEAKKEIEKDLVIQGEERMETPALSRLKMILAHVRGR